MIEQYLLGIRPSTEKGIHLGHYIGIIKPAQKLENLDVLIANLYDHETYEYIFEVQLKRFLLNVRAIYVQSCSVRELLSMQNMLSRIISVSQLTRMTQYKSKENPTVNLLTYPLLMTADLMFYGNGCNIVCGTDQHQHIQYANDFIEKYNKHYKTNEKTVKVFSQPSYRVMDLKYPEHKMSKSLHNEPLYLSDSKEIIEEKIMKAVTNELGMLNLKNIYKELCGIESTHTLAKELKEDILTEILKII